MAKQENSTDNIRVEQDYSRHGDVNDYLGSIIGSAWTTYRKRWQEALDFARIPDFPLFLVFENFFNCNLKCTMCIHSSDVKKHSRYYTSKLSFDTFEKIMGEASDHYCPSLTFGGFSEPLLDKRMGDMIGLATQSGFIDSMINTNATLLTEKTSRKLIENGLTRLRIGFEGTSPETYEKIRVGANYSQVERNIIEFVELREKLNSKLPIVRISCVELAENRDEIDGYIEHWKPYVDYVSIQRYKPHIFTADRTSQKKVGDRIKLAEARCSEPWNRVLIRGNGDLMPCCSPGYAPITGNIEHDTIYKMWNSAFMIELRQAVSTGQLDRFPTCSQCLQEAFAN